jgi:competence protein ComEC
MGPANGEDHDSMPLVTAAVLAYASGLLAGFSELPVVLLSAAALCVCSGSERPRDRLALGALCVAGIALGHAGRTKEDACAARVLRTGAAFVRLHTAATPGAFVGGEALCGARVRVAVVNGRAAEGSTVMVEGKAVGSNAGVLITDAALRPGEGAGLLPRWRTAIGRRIDDRFGVNAPLVRALLIADMRELSPAVRERFASAGLSHMLSVSGLHVGLIAVAVALVAQVAGLARRRADLLVIVLTTLYVAVIGAPLPAVRAAAMLAAMSFSVAMQRPTSAWAVLAVSALVPLLDPSAATDLGFQLSMVGMVALVSSGVLSKRLSWLRGPGWKGSLARGLVTSTIATLLTAPLVAATFGRISMVAPITNVVASPLMAVLQPMLFLVLLLLPFGGLAQFVADACHPLIAAIDRVAVAGAALPGASVPIVSDQLGLLLAYGAGAAFVLACVARVFMRPLLVGAGCVALLVWRPLLPARSGWTELHMIDVGQGDAIGLRTRAGRWVLFDAGRDWRSGDAGRRDVVPYIARRGGELAGFVLSHPHSDHVGGAASVIQALRPLWFVDPGYAGGTRSYRASLVAARDARTAWRRVYPRDSIRIDEVTITFLAPDSAWADSLRDPNDASTVARVRVGAITMLLSGDAERDEEEWLLRHQRELLDADVLKVAHHGSSTSSTRGFLQAVTPRLALVSVGAGNLYRHPSDEVIRSLAARGAVVMRTDRHGSVIVRTDGQSIEVESNGERWLLSP